jgi:hypothetical protein
MRLLLIVASILVVPVQVGAQTANTPFTPQTVHPDAPSTMGYPSTWRLADVRAAAGNVARWRDGERARIGSYELDWVSGVATNALPEISGFFAVMGDEHMPGGVVEGSWRRTDSAIGAPGGFSARYTHPPTICGARLTFGQADIDGATYLGSRWLPEFETLNAELLAAAPSPVGTQLPEGVYVPFATTPDAVRFYPIRALERNMEGVAEVACYVLPDYRAICGTVSETPTGWGFGENAERAMRAARVQEVASNGAPSAGTCSVRRVRFQLPH